MTKRNVYVILRTTLDLEGETRADQLQDARTYFFDGVNTYKKDFDPDLLDRYDIVLGREIREDSSVRPKGN